MNRSEIYGRNAIIIIIKTHRDKTSLGIENNAIRTIHRGFDGNTVLVILLIAGLLFNWSGSNSNYRRRERILFGVQVRTELHKTCIPVGAINAHAVRAGAAQARGSGVNVAAPARAQQRRSRCEDEDDGDRHYRRWHLAFPVGVHCEEEKAEDDGGVRGIADGRAFFDCFQICSVLAASLRRAHRATRSAANCPTVGRLERR